jgi:hypothetical protein
MTSLLMQVKERAFSPFDWNLIFFTLAPGSRITIIIQLTILNFNFLIPIPKLSQLQKGGWAEAKEKKNGVHIQWTAIYVGCVQLHSRELVVVHVKFMIRQLHFHISPLYCADAGLRVNFTSNPNVCFFFMFHRCADYRHILPAVCG